MQKNRKALTLSNSTDFFIHSKKHHIRAVFRIASFIVLLSIAYLFNLTTDSSYDESLNNLRDEHGVVDARHRNLLTATTIKMNSDTTPATTDNTAASAFKESGLVSHELLSTNVTTNQSSIVTTTSNATFNTTTSAYVETKATTSSTTCSLKVANPKSMIIAFIIGVLYMFIAIAIVCDELFVPALEILASEDYLNLSMDVAGATLMAAGGSAPELFTSIIGTFQESEIGFGTIVGSAVFNVLFVIAMCSFFSRDVLQLTWWPLFRDCTWYSFGLMTLAIWCGLVSPGRIEIWEAALQFSIYIFYVIFMKYNDVVYKWIRNKFRKKDDDNVVAVEDDHHIKPIQTGNKFQAGFCKLFLGRGSISDRVRDCMVLQMYGDVEEVFSNIDKNNDGFLEKEEIRNVLISFKCHPFNEDEIDAVMADMCNDDDSQIDLNAFKKWYITSEFGIKQDLEKIFNDFDSNNDNHLDPEEFKKLIKKLGSNSIPTDEQVNDAFKNVSNDSDSTPTTTNGEDGVKTKREKIDSEKNLTYKQFEEWYFKSPFWVEQETELMGGGHEDDEEGGVISDNLKPPEKGSSFLDYLRWIIALPIIVCLSFTVPDVRKKGREKYAVLTFFLSICWIGVLTYFMVLWTEIIGNTLGIPMLIMGLTFLAAGTSVPDLLTSVIVARMGEGDMAVSSSIGSNIFDICFGLPVPWLLYCFAQSAKKLPGYVTIGTDGMGVSILILLAMVICIIVIIHFSGWKLTKRVGVLMLFLYLLFLVQAIVRELPFKQCS